MFFSLFLFIIIIICFAPTVKNMWFLKSVTPLFVCFLRYVIFFLLNILLFTWFYVFVFVVSLYQLVFIFFCMSFCFLPLLLFVFFVLVYFHVFFISLFLPFFFIQCSLPFMHLFLIIWYFYSLILLCFQYFVFFRLIYVYFLLHLRLCLLPFVSSFTHVILVIFTYDAFPMSTLFHTYFSFHRS